MKNTAAIILAAGDGTRMKSSFSKVLCKVLYKPMINWVLDCCKDSEIENICTVVASKESDVAQTLTEDIEIAVQTERLGTAHAVKCAKNFINKHMDKDILILCGDAPFIDKETILKALELHREKQNVLTLVSAAVENPYGYGRIVRHYGKFSAIIEQSDCDPNTAQIEEVNSGVYWFKARYLLEALSKIQNDNNKKEYYLTDSVVIAARDNLPIDAYMAEDSMVVLGANDRRALAQLNKIAREIVINNLYNMGVDIPVTDGVIISPDAEIGKDTLILPGTIIKGHTTIGERCEIGPNSHLADAHIGDNTTILSSYITESSIGNHVKIGPFVQVRPKSNIQDYAKIGNFVEIKASDIGEHTSVAHLSYLGDSKLGRYVNVGCGVVTANYDGKDKHQTTIEDSAFIGCNTNFIPPVNIGKGSAVAAGSTITKDVPPYALAVAREKQTNIIDWAKKNGKYKKGSDLL